MSKADLVVALAPFAALVVISVAAILFMGGDC